jgi:phytoene synthase
MDHYAEAADVLRRRDRDRYLADLYAPEPARKHLFALHAFAADIARVRQVVREPALGEIRLQWWRDALMSGDAAGHPLAAALLETMAALKLPAAALDLVIESRIFDLYDDGLPTLDDLEGYAGETASAVLQLSAIVLAEGRDPGSADASGHAGVAETLVAVLRLLATDPAAAAKYIPDQMLEEHGVERGQLAARQSTPGVVALCRALRVQARRHLDQAAVAAGRLPPSLSPAYLLLAVAGARLDRMERNAANPFHTSDLTPWRRQWIIWRAARVRARAAPPLPT